MTFFRKGQTLSEVMLIIGVVGLALMCMQVYVKRGLQGRVKDLTDKIISNKQEAYPQDNSGLTTNTATTVLTADSTERTRQSLGGARRLTEVGRKTYDYNSTVIGN
jgi:hypothetical protein